jgi:DNA repair exonuclease SbcCD nuclease subunit
MTDQHFGRSGNNPVANQDNLDFIEWFIEEAKTFGADTCICMGDWHDNRANLAVPTLHFSLRGMEMLNAAFKTIWWIPGNHDLLYRSKRDISSVVFAKHLPNIRFVNEPTTIGGVTILPWLVGDEPKKVKQLKSRYVFGHLELNGGWLMNAKVPMPDRDGNLSGDDFKDGPDYVFSGHFHFRQAKGNMVYTGNIFPFNFSDNYDDDRGMMMLEWGREPTFKHWPDQPLFRTFKLSELLANPDKYLRQKLTARCTLDIDISFEESQVIKDTFIASHGLRKLELSHAPRQTEQYSYDANAVFQSTETIVVEGLLSVDSNDYDNKWLAELYKALPSA